MHVSLPALSSLSPALDVHAASEPVIQFKKCVVQNDQIPEPSCSHHSCILCTLRHACTWANVPPACLRVLRRPAQLCFLVIKRRWVSCISAQPKDQSPPRFPAVTWHQRAAVIRNSCPSPHPLLPPHTSCSYPCCLLQRLALLPAKATSTTKQHTEAPYPSMPHTDFASMHG